MLVRTLVVHSARSFPGSAPWDETFLEVQKVANDTARECEPREHVEFAWVCVLEVEPVGICGKTFVTVLWPCRKTRVISPLTIVSVMSRPE